MALSRIYARPAGRGIVAKGWRGSISGVDRIVQWGEKYAETIHYLEGRAVGRDLTFHDQGQRQDGMRPISDGQNEWCRQVLSIVPAGNRQQEEKPSLIQLLLSPGRNNVALCEAIATSAKQRTLNDHNALHGDNGNGNNSSTNVKPAE